MLNHLSGPEYLDIRDSQSHSRGCHTEDNMHTCCEMAKCVVNIKFLLWNQTTVVWMFVLHAHNSITVEIW